MVGTHDPYVLDFLIEVFQTPLARGNGWHTSEPTPTNVPAWTFQTPLARGNGWHALWSQTQVTFAAGFQTPLARGNGWHESGQHVMNAGLIVSNPFRRGALNIRSVSLNDCQSGIAVADVRGTAPISQSPSFRLAARTFAVAPLPASNANFPIAVACLLASNTR